MMKMRTIRRTGTAVSEIGFGGAPIGNLFRPVTDDQAFAAVQAAWEAGVRYFDTAPYYGFGLAEQRLGAALADKNPRDYVLSSKVGQTIVGAGDDAPGGLVDGQWAVSPTHRTIRDYSRDAVLRGIEGSLGRLGRDRLDIVYMHDPEDYLNEIERTTAPALAALREQGVISAFGVGTSSCETAERLVRSTDLDVVMIAGRWTLADRRAADLLALCAETGRSIVIAGPLNSGLLAHSWPADDARFDYRQAPPALIDRARELARICQAYGVALPEAALQFALQSDVVVSVVVGMASVDEVRADLAAAQARIPNELWERLV